MKPTRVPLRSAMASINGQNFPIIPAVEPELGVLPDTRDPPVLGESRALQVLRDHKATWARRATREFREQLVLQVRREFRAFKVFRE